MKAKTKFYFHTKKNPQLNTANMTSFLVLQRRLHVPKMVLPRLWK